jgi:hypothetical protein
MNLSEILNSGLSFSKSENGKLKIAGNPQTISDLKPVIGKLKPLILQWLEDKAKLQPRGAIEKTSYAINHVKPEIERSELILQNLSNQEIKRILEAAAIQEYELQKSGLNPALRAKIQELLSAGLEAEHGQRKDEFYAIVLELNNHLRSNEHDSN